MGGGGRRKGNGGEIWEGKVQQVRQVEEEHRLEKVKENLYQKNKGAFSFHFHGFNKNYSVFNVNKKIHINSLMYLHNLEQVRDRT